MPKTIRILETITPWVLWDFQNLDPTQPVTVEIASEGGDVITAIAIHNLLKMHPESTCRVLGLCASAATIISSACKNVIASPNAVFMCHSPWTFAQGNADELVEQAEVLRKFESSIRTCYTSKGIAPEVIDKWLSEDTWMTAEEAKSVGLCDQIDDQMAFQNAVFARLDILTIPPHIKDKLMPNPNPQAAAPQATAPAATTQTPTTPTEKTYTQAEFDAALAAANESAVNAELDRRSKIMALALPGQETFAQSLADDKKCTTEQAAISLLANAKTLNLGNTPVGNHLLNQSPKPVTDTDPNKVDPRVAAAAIKDPVKRAQAFAAIEAQANQGDK